jgi:hypothetical protein
MTNAPRIIALEDLVSLRVPPAEALQRLRAFGWDSDEHLVTLTREDLQRVLDRFLQQKLSAAGVELWANAIEGRDDIGFEEGFEAIIKDTVFQLATPEITKTLTMTAAQEWRHQLERT